jgi:hypothetical protein
MHQCYKACEAELKNNKFYQAGSLALNLQQNTNELDKYFYKLILNVLPTQD